MNKPDGVWKTIPVTAKVIALGAYAGIALLAFFLVPQDPHMRQWAEWQRLLFAFGMPLFLPPYVLLVGYVYGDAKRRGMRAGLWAALAAVVPYLIGMIVYFVMRDPIPAACINCGTQGRKGFAYCPKCGTALARACPACRRAAEDGWTHCAYCGCNLNAPVAQAEASSPAA
jgi:hypothetical protein